MNKCFPFLKDFRVSSDFGPRKSSESYVSKYHNGIDLVGIGSTDVVSCCDGTVYSAGYSSGLGNRIWINMEEGGSCVYCHLASISKDIVPGAKVSCKKYLGKMGSTGNSTGPHLHFGVSTNRAYTWSGSKWVNPANWFGISTYNLVGKKFDGSGMISGTMTWDLSTQQTIIANNSANSLMDYSPYGSVETSYNTYYKVKDIKGTYGDWLYGRRYRVIVDLANGEAFDVSDLRCVFECVNSLYNQASLSTIKIYNLSPDNENKLIKEGQRIVIEAGYEGSQYGIIYVGNIIQPIRSKENNGVDYVLTLVSLDSYRYQTYSIISNTLVAMQSSRDAINAAVVKAGDVTKVNYAQQIGTVPNTSITYPRGKVMFGNPTRYLQQIANSQNATYYNEEGKVNIVRATDYDKDTIISLDPTSGLIGAPTQTNSIISLRCLLNPLIKTNSLIHVDNSRIKQQQYSWGQAVRQLDNEGIYRVLTVTHYGDTRGEDESWYTQIEAASQSGELPGLFSTINSMAW